MITPSFNPKEKYRSIQSSNNGSIIIQNGSVFDEGHVYVGPAPVWGSDLFMKDGHPTDPHAVVLEFARNNLSQKEEAPKSVEEVLDEGSPRRLGRPKKKVKEDDASDDASGAL